MVASPVIDSKSVMRSRVNKLNSVNCLFSERSSYENIFLSKQNICDSGFTDCENETFSFRILFYERVPSNLNRCAMTANSNSETYLN